ncbi:LOW QUALITY PROTEIN: T-cell surface glycoprotein CD1a-like [Phyllostomus discolor]|uniref:LOW QUALITY PROTEIN: T-cell surface glycoprotein CD1a-like n=1 Tax=Phyllostomus discolor TaxID=89673 RepID=A0A7E6DJ29_9CHIR|nr:LOW QUALITY PROTEIN: T-cell surface glycoprotein CD1a-like [Phyllostomus discolor]
MLFLQISLLVVLLGGGDSEDAFPDQILRAIGTLSLHNHSWTHSWGSGWLGELQIKRWKSNSGGFVSLRPWSNGNFSNKEMKEIEVFVQRSHNEFLHLLHNHASEWMLEYPFEVQCIVGCELHSGESQASLLGICLSGSGLLSFQNNTWVPSPEGGTRAQQVCRLFNQYTFTNQVILRNLRDTCPRYLLSALDAGKADLQRQVKPEAWLSTHPNPGPDHLLLVCHVSGFYPKPISVMWMQGEQAQQGSQLSDILPNADGTWYLRVFLDVEATETSGLSCQVTHSSLEDQDIILYLDRPNSKGWIILAVMLPLLLLLTGLACWLKKCWTHCESPPTLLPLERFQRSRDSTHT